MSSEPAERTLVVTAHPDDVDFGAAGTVAGWVASGVEVTYCIVTDGDAGGFDPSVDRRDIPGIRRAEQTAAARVVGVTDLVFLGYPDGRLVPSLELRRDMSRVIRKVRPDRVLCPSPDRNYSRIFASHPDHLAAGEAALCAVYPDSRNLFAHPELAAEGLEPHSVSEVWMMGTSDADVYVDITERFAAKVAALRCHVSQLADPDAIEKVVLSWTASTAAAGGLPEGRLAEAFRRIQT